MNPSDPNLCPECGKPVPPTSQHQVCPACLLRQALDSATLAEGIPSAAANPPTPEEIADKFPQFEVTECLGRGGMGVVYKARQKSLDRWVAIKILPPDRVGKGKFAERFASEAAMLAKLSHPNIVTIHDFGETGGLYFIVMECVDGVNLRDLLREGKLDPQQALAIIPPICEALQYAHGKGIVHRDIKPENLLLDRDGRIKIADFGIAGLIGADGENIGTPPYMAPEQAGTAPLIDHRADIYALGVVLYEMLTGERPAKDLVAPSKKVQIDVRLDEMVMRALEKEPERRYQTANEFGTVVETLAGAMPSHLAAASSELVKTERARLTVQESPGTPVHSPALGEVALHGDRLVVSQGFSQRVIPLTNVTGLSEGVLPFWYSPAGHRFAAVDFEEAGHHRRLLFMPGAPLFSTVGSSRLRAGEWLTAIRRQVKSATGRELPISQTMSQHSLNSWMGLLWLLPVLVALSFFGGKMMIGGNLAGPAEAFRKELLWQFFIFGWPLLILVGIFVFRAWSIRQNRGVEPLQSRVAQRNTFRRWWWVLLVMIPLGMLLGLAVGGVWSYVAPRKFEVSTTLKCQSTTTAERTVGPAIGWNLMAGLESDETLSRLEQQLNLGIRWMCPAAEARRMLRQIITVEQIRGTSLVVVKVRSNDLEECIEISKTLPKVYAQATGCGTLVIDAESMPERVAPSAPMILTLSTLAGIPFGFLFALPLMSLLQRWFPERKPAASGPTLPPKLPNQRPSLVPTMVVHLILVAAVVALYLLFLPRYAAVFQDFGMQLPTITRLVLADPPNWLILFLSVLLALDLGCCSLARRLGGSRGLTWWTVGVIAGLVLFVGVAMASVMIPMRRMAEALGSETTTQSVQPPQPAAALVERSERVAVEDLALHLLVAIREKDDAKLKSLASDRIKGWPDALPVFAVELREHMRQFTGNDRFDLRASESRVDGELAVVKCTGPETLQGRCLVLNFVKTADGWRNHSLHNASEQTPLTEHLANLKAQIQRAKPPQQPLSPRPAEKEPDPSAH